MYSCGSMAPRNFKKFDAGGGCMNCTVHGVIQPEAGHGSHEVQLQGVMHFAAAEAALRALARLPDDGAPVVLELSRVPSANDIGRRMLREGMRRMGADGRAVSVVDPDGVLEG